MPRRLITLGASIFLASCSVVGIREAEEPRYQLLQQIGPLEIRQYAPRIAAHTNVSGNEMNARSAGFRRIADYIFGDNHARASIAMTAPVAQKSQTVAMTAPVAQARSDTGAWVIRFFMPAQYTMETLPAPNDPAVELVKIPAETYAVLRFSGSTAPAAVAAKQSALLDLLRNSIWHPIGSVVTWFYDPPWTLPPFRRTEVAVQVSQADHQHPRPPPLP